MDIDFTVIFTVRDDSYKRTPSLLLHDNLKCLFALFKNLLFAQIPSSLTLGMDSTSIIAEVDDTKGYLESLPTEIQILILLQISTLKDLQSLIHASAHFYAAFRLSKAEVLSAVLRRIIHPSAISDALSAVTAERFEHERIDKEQITHFLDYFKTVHDVTRVIPLSKSISLCQLHESVDYFVQRCSKQWLSVLQDRSWALEPSLDLEDRSKPKPLSFIEEARLQRALYRFEFYCRIYQSLDALYSRPVFDATNQSRDFLALFPHWQIEELACVRDYVYQQLRFIFDRVEDDFVKYIIAEDFEDVNVPQHYNRFYHKPSSCVASGVSFDDYFSPDRFDNYDYFFGDAEKSRQLVYMEYIMSRGLPFLHRLLEADSQTRNKLVLANTKSAKEFLSDALEKPSTEDDGFNLQECIDFSSGVKLAFDGDGTGERNEAWLWSNDFRPWPMFYEHDKKHLRRWGYVFWDSSRLRVSGILDAE